MATFTLSPRAKALLREHNIVTRAELQRRRDELEGLGLTPRAAAEIRKRLDQLPDEIIAESADAPTTTAILDLPPLLTTTEAADLLRWNRRTVANKCLDGHIRATRLGDDWRIPRAEVLRLLGQG